MSTDKTTENQKVGEYVRIDKLHPHHKNPRHNDHAVDSVANSIKRFGFTSPIIANKDGTILAGHTRYKASKQIGLETVPVVYVDLSPVDAELLMIADNKLGEKADWNTDQLSDLLTGLKEQGEDLDVLGFEDEELDELLQGFKDSDAFDAIQEEARNVLADIFIVPPVSILDTRRGPWQERKRYWNTLIQDKGESREGTLFKSQAMLNSYGDKPEHKSVSILDATLAEILVTWFSEKDWLCFDPFAGDTVFGYVAGSLERKFRGTELREEQARINNERTAQFDCIYYNDDAQNLNKYVEPNSVDMIFSCPPYADLEQYSDDPRDLSNMKHEDFFDVFKSVLQNTYSVLKDNRFACIVISEVRNKKTGEYISVVPKTIQFMVEAGYQYWNEMILITMMGSLRMRCKGSMNASRKVGRTHQNVLVFYKGDQKNIKQNFTEFSFEGVEDEID